MEREMENGGKNDGTADSPTSVLEDEEMCNGQATGGVTSEEEEKPQVDGNRKNGVAFEEDSSLPLEFEAKNGDTSLITEAMTQEEEKLLEARVKEDMKIKQEEAQDAQNPNFRFSKLDELLTQTQLYSEFLLEKMDDITFNGMENHAEAGDEGKGKKTDRGRKRKATTQYNTRKAKTAVAAMLTRSHETIAPEDADLTEEERAAKEQAKLVPLMTGGKLKSYQTKGVKWLISLWQNGLNGILADQMGLGKTIQTIGFLAHLKGKGLDGPYMIIAPLSTLSNWVNEVSRFVPSMSAIIYHGSKKERMEMRRKFMPQAIGPKFPLVVTSYEVALNDAKVLAQYKWKYVVVDEGHRLKNSKCILLRELRRLPIENKLLLTGTPLQNNLAELWSLLNFILPDIFSSHQEFESWFDLSGRGNVENQQEESEEKRRVQVVSKLHSILRPFLLRRMKEDVEQLLPRKKEIILYANMTQHQKHLQDLLVNKSLENYLQEKADNIVWRSGMKGKLNNLVVQLRKNCNHPDLLESAYDGSYVYPPIEQLVEQCGKFQLLDRLLGLLLARKHKVLIFSQWTKVLDIMDYYFSEKGLEICRIDGGVKLDERKRQIEAFNDPNSDVNVFLLSTRAGGLGINLAAADTCILYDSDWNPQMDLQAMDRCHRIGQTRPVHVYRLATSHSVEGRIIKKAFGKLKLEHVVIAKGQFQQDRVKPNTFEESELLALLRDEEDEEDKLIQTDISDEDLLRVLDRSDLTGPADGDAASISSLPLRGPGWEVVIAAKSGGSVLSSLSS
ncbi:ATP-dependent DNA helicase DDM1 isoform X2 [Phoenix dactylifera]|uniref:ATP-dependent DNA helicase DDM1 isoform X2 n=1 Tax=Phoenix dactylifera TaxID=42345 RepID=A0A8B9AA21_PHODC|nr:ATP-dependent DNA helicase DDM1 isoform X2 [Phoenix dactylifera]